MYGDVPMSSIPPVNIGPKPIEVSREAKTQWERDLEMIQKMRMGGAINNEHHVKAPHPELRSPQSQRLPQLHQVQNKWQ